MKEIFKSFYEKQVSLTSLAKSDQFLSKESSLGFWKLEGDCIFPRQLCPSTKKFLFIADDHMYTVNFFTQA